MHRRWAWIPAAALFGLVGCGGGGGNPAGGSDDDAGGNPTGSSSVDSLTVDSGKSQTLDTPDVMISGDCTIDGTLNAPGPRMLLTVGGDLTLNGTLNAAGGAARAVNSDPNTPLRMQEKGIYLVVKGKVTIGDNAQLNTDGNVLVTDDETQLDRTVHEAFAEADSASGDLPTIVPLPPDDPAFSRAGDWFEAPTRQATLVATLGGRWNLSGLPGDEPVVLVRFNTPDLELRLRNLELTGPQGTNGQTVDHSADADQADQDAKGGDGKRGMNLNIWNNSGPIKVVGRTVLNLPAGGDGGDAVAVCAKATGGNGGQPGNFRMTAAGGIDLTAGSLLITPGRGGHGGEAVATSYAAADGCPGEDGCDVTATGGKGADNQKRLSARGTVSGLANITIGQVSAGYGGDATATGGYAGSGAECCDGGQGGDGTATGGAGGDASIAVTGLPAATVGATGGPGGVATATGGDGGDGGDCKVIQGGSAGAGGKATATGGAGGLGSTGGRAGGGHARATGGSGGSGGDSAAAVGPGGAGGKATATGGDGGVKGLETEKDGEKGVDGNKLKTKTYCFTFGFLTDGVIAPGTYTGPLYDSTGMTQVGTLPMEFRNVSGATYAKQSNPPHFGFGGGQVDFRINEITGLGNGLLPVLGVDLAPLYGEGISTSNPLQVQGLGANGQVLTQQNVSTVPDNQGQPDSPDQVQVSFDEKGITVVRLIAPPNSFVTILKICFVDP